MDEVFFSGSAPVLVFLAKKIFSSLAPVRPKRGSVTRTFPR